MPEFETDLPVDLDQDPTDFTDGLEQGAPEPVPPDLMEWAEKRAKELSQTFEHVRNSCSEDHYKLIKAFKDYINYMDPNDIPYDTKLIIPMVLNHIRITFARWLDAARATEKLVRVRPARLEMDSMMGDPGVMDADMQARLGEAGTNASLSMGNVMLKFLQPVMDVFITGRVITRTGWSIKYRWNKTLGKMTDKEWATVHRVSPWNFYMDPYALDEQHARWTFELLEQTEEDVREFIQSRIYLPDTLGEGDQKYNRRLTPVVSGSGMYNQARQTTRSLRNRGDMSGDIGYYHVVESWTYEDPYNHGVPELWCFFFDAQTGKLLGCHPNPYNHGERPYEVGWILPVPDQPYGIGIAESLHPLMHAQSSTLQHIYDNFKDQNVRHLVLSGYIDEAALATSRSNGIVRGDDMNAWKIMQGAPMHPESWQFLSFFDGKAQETSGVTDVVTAVKAAATAYASDMLKGQAQLNFNVFIDCLKLSWMDKVARHSFSNCQQFQSTDVIGKLELPTGQAYPVPVRGADYQGDYIVDAYDLRAVARRATMAQQLGTLMTQALQANIPMNYPWLFKQIYSLLDLPESETAFNPQAQLMTPTPVAPEGPPGISGQNIPSVPPSAEAAPPQTSDAVRLAMTQGAMGETPTDLQGLLGGAPAAEGGQ